jgi:hypothetical protein
MGCACDSGLESAKIGAELQSDLQAVQALRSNGERWDISLRRWHLDWSKVDSPVSAEARATKSERNVLYHGAGLIQSCAGSYPVWYHLTKVDATWKVDQSRVLGPGLSCRSA